MFGHVAGAVLAQDHQLLGTCRGAYDAQLLGDVVAAEQCFDHVDSGDEERLLEVMKKARPDVILNCVGIVKQLPAARDLCTMIRVNSLFPHQLATLADSVGAKLVHLSTDCVFSGAKGAYRLTDNPDPVDMYGRSKLLGEVTQAPHLTLRLSIIGRQLRGNHGLLEWFIGQRGSRVRGYRHAVFTGLTTHALASLIGDLLKHCPELSGLYHVASTPISKLDLLTRLNEKLGLGIEIDPETEYCCDRSLDGREFHSDTRIEIPSWEEMLEQLARESQR